MEGGGVSENSFKVAMKGDGKYLVITPLVILLPVAYWYFTAPPPGWCVAQKRLLTNKEYIEFVVPKLNDGQKVVDGKPVINCCSVDRQGGVYGSGGIISKMFRLDDGVEVSWNYELSEEGKVMRHASLGETHYAEIRLVDSCATKIIEQAGIATN